MAKVKKNFYLHEEDLEKLDAICKENNCSRGEQIAEWINNHQSVSNNLLLDVLREVEKQNEKNGVALDLLFKFVEHRDWFDRAFFNELLYMHGYNYEESQITRIAEDVSDARVTERKIRNGEIKFKYD